VRVGEEDRDAGLDLEHGVSGQLLATVPGQGSAKVFGQRGHCRCESVLHGDRPVSSERRTVLDRVLVTVSLFAGQVDQHRESGSSLDERPDGRAF